MVGIADEAGDRMPFGGQDLGEAQRDLAVPSGDDDMHTAQPNPARGGAGRSARSGGTTRIRTAIRDPAALSGELAAHFATHDVFSFAKAAVSHRSR
ncbi:hypothetical protein GALLR39Z86_34010 [Glycomyces algeriensis]|uniref:Uncharacterized protein n=1 Tax=Glycomyces algeriensis TaxID=256037 RepID=A0A9W6GAM5_9ACTN|nr:hypothetical protein GALLR39Z86_34010 [Glycomyces algeriensis]